MLPFACGSQVLVTMGTFFALAYVGMKYYLHFDELWVSEALRNSSRVIMRPMPFVGVWLAKTPLLTAEEQ